MIVLDENNARVDLETVTKNVPVRYCVLDFAKTRGSGKNDGPDYFFREVIMVEEYTSRAALLAIGPYSILVPDHWSIMVTYADQAEVVAIEDVLSKDLCAFCINPIDGYMPSMLPIRVKAFIEMTWVYPTMNPTEMLLMPIGDPPQRIDVDSRSKRGPICIVAGEKLKVPETMNVGVLI